MTSAKIVARSLLILSLSLPTAMARDLYVIQGRTVGRSLPLGESMVWLSDIVFFNDGNSVAEVRPLEVSNGSLSADVQALVIQPKQSASVQARPLGWVPATDVPLWVLHLDVPEQITAQGVLAIGSRPVNGPPDTRAFRFGKSTLPIFTRLTPPTERSLHLATDLGSEIPAHLNVAIYNDAADVAEAHIEIRQQCDDSIMAEQTTAISAKTLQVFNGFSAKPKGCTSAGTTSAFDVGVYVVIAVNRPSLSFVSTVADEIPTRLLLHLSR